MDEKRIISQITNGAVQSEKLTDYSIRGDVGLAAILAYGNQIEALASTCDPGTLPREINKLSTRQANRYRPYRAEGKSRETSSKIQNCSYCGSSHAFGRCPAFGKQCRNCDKLNHFASVCRAKAKAPSEEVKKEAKVDKN